jgi:hypothetical protein
MVLIPLSGGWKSAYILVHWLRTNKEKCAAFHARLPGDPWVNRRTQAYAGIRGYVEMNFPGRVRWLDANVSGDMPWDATKPAEVLGTLLGMLMKSPSLDVSGVIAPCEIPVDKRRLKVRECIASEAKAMIPEPTFRNLFTCEAGPLSCGLCSACLELAKE